jgi:DNA-binding transcriptional ArsR family regulator
MEEKTGARLRAQAQVMKALAHPTRLFIVQQLAMGERCVCEITDMVGADVSTVSKHLSLLRHAGIVDIDKRGTSIYYSLKMPCVLNFFACVETVLRQRAEEQMALVR